MNEKAARFVRFSVGLAGLVTLGWVLAGHASPPVHNGMPLPFDWSHRHLIYSQPKTAELLQRVEQDPRYWQQMYRGSVPPMGPQVGAEISGWNSQTASVGRPGAHRDWARDMGSGASTGAGNYPAKFSFDSATASCGNAAQPDFVVFGTGLAGSPTQASVVAFDNLYLGGCTPPIGATYWAYDTGGQVRTSPVLSRDGSQIAFVQTSAGAGTLVLLKWAPGGTISVPVTLTSVALGAYRACTAPCMTTIALTDILNNPTDDTTSSVFYYYVGDTAWVGDSVGVLHQFTGIFLGTPAEVRTVPWPVQVNPLLPTAATSPVFDRISGNVLMADAGGFLYRVDSTTGLVTTSSQLDFGVGFVEGPIVDSGAATAYVFASSDGTANCSAGNPCSAVYQLSTTFLAGDVGTETAVGTSDPLTPNPMYDGGFDSAYLNSANATGNLYVCGNTGANPALFQVPIQAGVLGTALSVTVLSPTIDIPTCSPVTDVFNPNAAGGPAEWLFVSVQHHGLSAACSDKGCLLNFKVTPWKPSTAYVVGQEIFSSKLHIEVVTTAGTSGAAPPNWSNSAGGTNIDGSVHWLDQGVLTASTPFNWQASHNYPRVGNRIVDSNGNIEVVRAIGISGASAPAWSMTPGLTTTDNTVTWINAGGVATHALLTDGGTSGIIIDNVVGSLPGASQVYFSTLADQTCGGTGFGGCAVQTSQPALQ